MLLLTWHFKYDSFTVRSSGMKKTILFLLLLHRFAIAQDRPPTYFDNFTKNPGIEWAGWRLDTVHFTNINLSEMLRKKYEQNKIKVCIPEGIGDYAPCCMHYASKCEIKWGPHCDSKMPIFDSLGNVVKKTKEEQLKDDEFIPQNNFTDSAVFNLLNVPQLFYIENNKLKVFIPYVITMRLITTSQGVNLGPAYYFAAGFNFNRLRTGVIKDQVIFIGQTTKNVKSDSMFIGYQTYQVKQLYEKDLIKTLWSLILNHKIKMISPTTNQLLSMDKLNDILNTGDKIPVPFYDSTGTITSKGYFYPDKILPTVFKEIQINQQWYYNETKNIVFCNIPEIILYAPLSKNGEYEKESSPVIKILFKN